MALLLLQSLWLFSLVRLSLKGWRVQPRDEMLWVWPTKPHVRVVSLCSWASEEHEDWDCLHLSFSEASPLCMNKYLLGRQGFYSPSEGHSAGLQETRVFQCLLNYLSQQNGSERRPRERARGQVCSLIAEASGCQESPWLFIAEDTLSFLEFKWVFIAS